MVTSLKQNNKYKFYLYGLGRGKSTIHKFIADILRKVMGKMEDGILFNKERPGRDIMIPHCTWVNKYF